MNVEMVDLFGRYIDSPGRHEKASRKRSTTQDFRDLYGYDTRHKCGACRHMYKLQLKPGCFCKMRGTVASDATRITPGTTACTLYEDGGSGR